MHDYTSTAWRDPAAAHLMDQGPGLASPLTQSTARQSTCSTAGWLLAEVNSTDAAASRMLHAGWHAQLTRHVWQARKRHVLCVQQGQGMCTAHDLQEGQQGCVRPTANSSAPACTLLDRLDAKPTAAVAAAYVRTHAALPAENSPASPAAALQGAATPCPALCCAHAPMQVGREMHLQAAVRSNTV